MKNRITEIRNLINSLTVLEPAEEMSELEERSVENVQIEAQRKKYGI